MATGSRPPDNKSSSASDWTRETGKTEIVRPLTEGDSNLGSAPEWQLLVIDGDEIGQRFTIKGRRTRIGRDPSCEVRLADMGASRVHCSVVRAGAALELRDENSTNGIFVNGRRVQVHAVVDGDILRIGRTSFKFLSAASVETRYHMEIFNRSTLDELTGLYNRRYLFELLVNEILRAARHERNFSVVLFDIDHFKAVNDTHGHVVGDLVLRGLAERVATAVRRNDVVARYGGEEFAIVAPETALVGGAILAENVRRAVAQSPIQCGDLSVPVTISAGVADFHEYRTELRSSGNADSDSWIPALPALLIGCADRKLYQAKRNGRNQVIG